MGKRRKPLAAFIVVLLLVLSSCGSESSRNYFYSVKVVNNTDASILVRYDWDYIWWTYEWVGKETVPMGNSQIIEWSSGEAFNERIEVEYLGIKRPYIVPQVGTITVAIQDFQS